jgi:hypothetical protein
MTGLNQQQQTLISLLSISHFFSGSEGGHCIQQWFSTFFSQRHLFTLNYFCNTYNFFWRHTQFLKQTKLIDYIMFAREAKPSIHSYDTKFYEKGYF